ncbi:MAG: nucleotidyltransferase [Bacteroidales bacterium]|nr:nucleotidyltransferase [Bacteroidales bacterium]
MKPTLLILAAGIGSRYGGFKQIDKVGPSGETIMDYSIYDALKADFGKIVFVIRQDIEKEFNEVILPKFSDKVEVDYVFQEIDMIPSGIQITNERIKPWGTGHAVLVAVDKINEPFAVINADDFYGRNSFRILADYLVSSESEADYCMVGYQLGKTLSEYGYVARGVCKTDPDNFLNMVTERTNIEKLNDKIVFTEKDGQQVELTGKEIVSMNLWGFKPPIFGYLENYFRIFIQKNSDNPKAEFFIPIMITELIQNKQARIKVLESGDKWFGVTYREDKPAVVRRLKELVDQGVYPESLWE